MLMSEKLQKVVADITPKNRVVSMDDFLKTLENSGFMIERLPARQKTVKGFFKKREKYWDRRDDLFGDPGSQPLVIINGETHFNDKKTLVIEYGFRRFEGNEAVFEAVLLLNGLGGSTVAVMGILDAFHNTGGVERIVKIALPEAVIELPTPPWIQFYVEPGFESKAYSCAGMYPVQMFESEAREAWDKFISQNPFSSSQECECEDGQRGWELEEWCATGKCGYHSKKIYASEIEAKNHSHLQCVCGDMAGSLITPCVK